MRSLLPFVLFLVFFNSLAQSDVLSGTVQDVSGKPVSDAVITITGLNQNTVTDEKGRFQFKHLPHGSYTLWISSVEIIKKSFSVEFASGSKPFTFKVEPSKSVDLEELSVIGKTEKRELETVGFATNVIETQKFALQSIQTNELLDRTAGVRIRQDGGLGSHIHYNINGMTGNAVKIFIDGVPSTNYGQSFSLNSIPPALIERIEVYKGVVPGYLSDDALGGAINIVLKKSRKSVLNTSYSYGSFNTNQFNINGSHRTGSGFSVDVSGFFNYSDNNYEVWGEEITFRNYQGGVTPNQRAKRFHDAYRSYGVKTEAGWSNVKWADKIAIGGVFSDDYKEIQNGVTLQRVFGDRHSTRQANIATFTYNKRDVFTKGLSLKVDASYSWLKTQVIDSVGIMYDWRGPILFPDGTPVRYTSGAELGNTRTAVINRDNSFMTRANLGYQINAKNTIYVNYLFNAFERGSSDKFLALGLQLLQNTRDLKKNIATFTYENISVSNRLKTNVFYKYYFQKITSNEPYQISATPPQYGVRENDKTNSYHGVGGAMSFALSSQIYLLTSAERAIRFPNEREVFGSPESNLNPGNVNPEQSFNANVGVNLGKYTFGVHGVRLNTSVFYRDTKGMIREAITPGNSGTSYFENLEDVLTKGIDVELIYNYTNKLDLTFNLSKFDVLFNTKYNKEGAEYLYYRKQIRNEPSFKYNANASYYIADLFQKNSRASLHYSISYVKGFRRNWSNIGLTNLDNIPTQFANDAGVMYTFPSRKITLSFNAKNIFNERMYDNFGLQKPGRAFYGKVTYNIL